MGTRTRLEIKDKVHILTATPANKGNTVTGTSFTSPEMEDYRCWLDFPEGWIGLNLEWGSPYEVDMLAAEAIKIFNPLELMVTKTSLQKEIKRLALSAFEDQTALAAACYTAGGGYVALFEVDIYGEEGKQVGLEDIAPMLTQKKDAKLFGDPEVTHTELPLGPATRVNAMFKTKKFFGLGQRLVQCVQYAIAPPTLNDVLVTTMRWDALERSDELVEVADDLASLLRIIPCDADGNPIDPDSPK